MRPSLDARAAPTGRSFEVSRASAWRTSAVTTSTTSRPRPHTMRSSRCSQARRLPRRESLHHLGLQVRAAEAAVRCGVADGRTAKSRSTPSAGAPSAGSAPRRPSRRRASSWPRSTTRSSRPDPPPAPVLVAPTLDGVPIDVLAERLATTRGALYKTLHDARRKKLRARLTAGGAVRVPSTGE